MGLDQWNPIYTKDLSNDLNNGAARYLHQRLVESSITRLRNEEKIIPVQNLKEEKIAYLALGTSEETSFQKALSRYQVADQFFLPKETDLDAMDRLAEQLQSYSKVIVGIHRSEERRVGKEWKSLLVCSYNTET